MSAYCPKCGAPTQPGAAKCEYCGAALPQEQPVQTAQPVQPVQVVYEQPAPPQPQQSMGWFKFLINFALWAGAILNILSAFPVLTGSQYGDAETVELVYATFDGLKGLDMISGILAIVLGVFGIYTRFQLAGFKAKGPKLLTILYAGAIVSNIIYIIGYNALLPEYVLASVNMSSFISNSIVSAVMIFVNQSYFKKREHLFVN